MWLVAVLFVLLLVFLCFFLCRLQSGLCCSVVCLLLCRRCVVFGFCADCVRDLLCLCCLFLFLLSALFVVCGLVPGCLVGSVRIVVVCLLVLRCLSCCLYFWGVFCFLCVIPFGVLVFGFSWGCGCCFGSIFSGVVLFVVCLSLVGVVWLVLFDWGGLYSSVPWFFVLSLSQRFPFC